MGATASLDGAELSVEPGATVSTVLRIRNTGRVVDQFSVEILGPAAAWSRIEPPSIPLFPGAEGTVTVIASPPRSPSVPAGSCPFGLKVHAAEDPSDSVVEEGVIRIGPYFDVTAELVPRTSRGRLRALHDLAVDNRSNVPFNADFTGSDLDSLLGFTFKPPVLSITPGNAGFTKVKVRPRRRFWRGAPITRPFEIQVRNDQFPPEFQDPSPAPPLGSDHPTGPNPVIPPPPGAPSTASTPVAPTLSVEGSMLQEAMLPGWLPQVVAVVVILALILTLLWFTLFKPQIKSAAKDQVSRQLAAAGITTATTVPGEGKPLSGSSSPVTEPGGGANSGTGSGAAGSGVATGSGAAGYNGSAVDGRLGVSGNSQQTYVVPAGKVLQLTDVDFQNPAGDTGTVILARNNSVLFQLSLANFRDLDYHWISPIVFAAGDKMSLITTGCSATCSPGMYYAGFLANS